MEGSETTKWGLLSQVSKCFKWINVTFFTHAPCGSMGQQMDFLPTVPGGGTMDLQMDFFFSFSFISFSTPPTLGVGWDCTVLYCIVLYCTVLYCIVLYYTVLYCIVLYCTVLYCTVLYCTVLYCTVLYCTVLLCTVLYCTVLYCKKKYSTPPKKNPPPKKITPTPKKNK